MDLVYINRPAFAAYAYLDTLPRGFGFHSKDGWIVLRLGRLVVELEIPEDALKGP